MEEQTDLRQVATRTLTVVRQRTPGTQDQPHGPKRRAERSDARQRSGTPHEHTPRPQEARGQARSASRERAHRPPEPGGTGRGERPSFRAQQNDEEIHHLREGGARREGTCERRSHRARKEERGEEVETCAGGRATRRGPARARARATAGSRARHAARQRAAHRGTTDGARDGSPPALKSRARTLSNFS